MKTSYTLIRLTIALIAFIVPVTIYAEDGWIGEWKSEPIKVDTETLTMILEFNDSTDLLMGFETDNRIPDIGQCVSYISVNCTYDKYGPVFITHVDEKSLHVEIKKLEFDETFTDKMNVEQVAELKNSFKKQILTNAERTFAGYDGGMMIYVTHDDPDVMSFIFGDETNCMELKFTRMN